MLEVQLSKARRKRIERVCVAALKRAGAPYGRWVIYVKDSSNGTEAAIYPRDVFMKELANKAKFNTAKQTTYLLDIMARIERKRGEVPELVCFDEGGAELWFMQVPDGTF